MASLASSPRSQRAETGSPLSQSHRDIKAYAKGNSVLEPLQIYRGHSSVVEDVAWQTESESVFASVGDDKMLLLWVFLKDNAAPTSAVF